MSRHVYKQSTGQWMLPNGLELAKGYAGNGEAMNNPAMQSVSMHGPLPQGFYTIGKPYDNPRTGKFTMNLDPAPENEMFGRSAFRCHGDNSAANHTASDGCIILDRTSREWIAASSCDSLEVVA